MIRKNYLVVGLVLLCALMVTGDRVVAWPLLRSLTTTLWSWVLILGACAILLGVGNVLVVHCRRVLAGGPAWAYSLVLVATALAVFVMGLLGPGGSRSPFAEWVFGAVLVPGMGTLFALTAFFLAAAAWRFLRIESVPADGAQGPNRRAQGGGWMLAGATLFLLLQTPMLNAVLPAPVMGFAGWVLDVPAMATLRGVLLGGSLALVFMGLRLALAGR